MAKLVHIRKPRLRVSPSGVRLTKPTARIGRKAGLNISSRGVSASVRTKAGTFSTRGGFTSRSSRRRARRKGCGTVILAAAGIPLLLALLQRLLVG